MRKVVNDCPSRWTVIGDSPNKLKALCECACGTVREVYRARIASGQSKSCGCLAGELTRARGFRHGGYGSPTYRTWQAMIKRCNNSQCSEFKYYGGRGISVCDRWRYSFAAFLEDAGMRPSEEHSLDRYPDMNGNYEPGNVRWATLTQQNRNKRTNRRVTINGESLTVSQLVQCYGVSHRTICNRLSAGWPVERAIIKPVQQEARSEGMRRAWARRKEAA